MNARLRLATFVCAVVATIGACAPETPVIARSDELMLYLVLYPGPLENFQTEMRALVATAGTPFAVDYRSADRFVMRRASDGAVFDWREDTTPPHEHIVDGKHLSRVTGNYVLAESASTRGLGRLDLMSGETYTVEVTVGNHTITGQTTIPTLPQPVVVDRPDGTRAVEWPRDSAVGDYRLTVRGREYVTVDTIFVLQDLTPPGYPPTQLPFRIIARDTSWVRYMSDSSVVRAGLHGGYGLLASHTSTQIVIPAEESP